MNGSHGSVCNVGGLLNVMPDSVGPDTVEQARQQAELVANTSIDDITASGDWPLSAAYRLVGGAAGPSVAWSMRSRSWWRPAMPSLG